MIKPNPTTRATPSKRDAGALPLLKALAPPQTLIHIGAGTGQGELNQWHAWGVASVLVVDADLERMGWAEQLATNNAGWQVRSAIVAGTDGPVTYHQASNPSEDGLIPAQKLSAMWPNLRAAGEEQRTAHRLDTLLSQANAPATAHGNTWLLVDCLPALPILQGAAATLAHCTVVAVRALLQPVAGIKGGVALAEIDSYLQRHGFKCVDTIAGHQPAIGHALFVLDWHAALQQQLTRYNAQTQLASEHQTSLAALQAQRDQLAQEQANLIAANAQLTSTTAQLTAQRDADAAATADTMAQRDAEAAGQAEAFAQLDRLRQQRSKLIADYDQLAKARDQLALDLEAEFAAKVEALAAREVEAQAKLEAVAQRDSLAQERANLVAANADLAGNVTQLAHQRDAEAAAKTQALAERDAEAAAKVAALAQRDAEATAKVEALAAREVEAQAKLEAVAQRDSLAQERANLVAANADLAGNVTQLAHQRDAEAAAKTQALAERDAEAAAKVAALAQRDDAVKQAVELRSMVAAREQELTALQQRIQQLELVNNEHTYRHQLQQEEFIKAEAQIDLIKDLLLRESGL